MNSYILTKIQELNTKSASLKSYDDRGYDSIANLLLTLIEEKYGNGEFYKKIKDSIEYTYSFEKHKLISALEVLKTKIELEYQGEERGVVLQDTPKAKQRINQRKIFIVHGSNDEMKQGTARYLEKLGFEPIILHEQPNEGRTIISKFTAYSDVGFAIILLSADDYGFKRTETIEKKRLRGRQNVILELGFFLGKLGTKRVVVLKEITENFELPSDYSGVVYIDYDAFEGWRTKLAKELKNAGYVVDLNKAH